MVCTILSNPILKDGLLSSVSELESSTEVLRFQSALALQCFTNEYVYEVSDAENKALEALEARVSDKVREWGMLWRQQQGGYVGLGD